MFVLDSHCDTPSQIHRLRNISLDNDYAHVDLPKIRRGGVDGKLAVMPGFIDLGVNAEYALSRKLSFWLRGGNLLDMEIQRNLMYAEKGINFTAGICLSL